MDKSFSIKYSFNSSLGTLNEARYIMDIEGLLYEEDDYGDFVAEAGKIQITIIHRALAINQHYDVTEIFEHRHSLIEIANKIFDYDTGEFVEQLEEYAQDAIGSDIFIIERMEILPEYRSKNLGKIVIKDIYNRFNEGCNFFVLKIFPLQFEAVLDSDKNDSWYKAMSFDKLEQDKELAQIKLLAFYQRCGFELLSDVSEELMFINPSKKNIKMDAIELD